MRARAELRTATFGGTNEFFNRWGTTDVKEASRLIDISLEYGINFLIRPTLLKAKPKKLGEVLKATRKDHRLNQRYLRWVKAQRLWIITLPSYKGS
jgi:hypothetical protein